MDQLLPVCCGDDKWTDEVRQESVELKRNSEVTGSRGGKRWRILSSKGQQFTGEQGSRFEWVEQRSRKSKTQVDSAGIIRLLLFLSELSCGKHRKDYGPSSWRTPSLRDGSVFCS